MEKVMRKQKRWILAAFLVAGMVMFTACAPSAPKAEVKTESEASPQTPAQDSQASSAPQVTELFNQFTAVDSNGNDVTQDIFSGHKLTMVNIWATYCGPCLNEMPELGELNKEYKDKGFQVVGMPIDVLNQDGSISQEQVDLVNEIAEKTGADYTHILPSQDLIDAKLKNVTAVPETVFVDENGNQVGKSYMGARSKEKWQEIIDGLLASMPDTDDAQAPQKEDAQQAAGVSSNISGETAMINAPIFYEFTTTDMDGNTVTDQILNEGTQLTLALVWDPAWEGNAQALQKMQEYLKGSTAINGIGFVLNADGKETEIKETANHAGADFPQLKPTQELAGYILGDEPLVLAIAPWGSVVGKPLAAGSDVKEWSAWIDDALTDVNSGCCG